MLTLGTRGSSVFVGIMGARKDVRQEKWGGGGNLAREDEEPLEQLPCCSLRKDFKDAVDNCCCDQPQRT